MKSSIDAAALIDNGTELPQNRCGQIVRLNPGLRIAGEINANLGKTEEVAPVKWASYFTRPANPPELKPC